jgi:hypothetical protein
MQTLEEGERSLLEHAEETLQAQTYAGFVRGIHFLQQDKHEIAIGCFTTSIGLLPLCTMYIFRSIAFIGYKMFAKAISDCDYVISSGQESENIVHVCSMFSKVNFSRHTLLKHMR